MEEIKLSDIWAFITAIGVMVTALISLLNYRNTTRFNLPDVFASLYSREKCCVVIRFNAKAASGPKWLITSVRLKGTWRRHLSEAIPSATDPYGHPDRFDAVTWQRCIPFDPPVPGGYVLLHNDSPQTLSICFDVCLKSSPKVRSRVIQRMVISD